MHKLAGVVWIVLVFKKKHLRVIKRILYIIIINIYIIYFMKYQNKNYQNKIIFISKILEQFLLQFCDMLLGLHYKNLPLAYYHIHPQNLDILINNI